MTRHLFAIVVVFLFTAPTMAAPPTDVAEVFPPTTLAYAELSSPTELGPQLAALFKGTPLEDSIPFIHDKKNAAKTLPELHGKRELAELALLVSPEVLADFRKLGGIAVGLTGFNDQGEPEVAIAVLTGDSAVAGLAARAFITTSTNLRKVAEVSKVPVFQYRQPIINYDNNGNPKLVNDKPPTEGPYELTFAYTRGLFVAGSNKAAIAPLIKRFLGEEKDSLLAADSFKVSAAEYRKPGLFFYVNAPELLTKLDTAGRNRGDPIDSDLIAWLRITANQKALKSIAGRIYFRDGGLALLVNGKLDPTQKSPLADFFSGPPVKVDALHHARKPASFAATVNLPDKNRAAVLIDFLDAMAKANGVLGRLPSDLVKELEEKHKTSLRDGLLAKVRGVTVMVPARQQLPKGARPVPMLVLSMEDAAAAAALEEFLPKLAGELAGEKPAEPSSETVGGVKVFSLPATGLPWKSAIHYTRKDAILVLGQDRKLVAATITPDAATSVAGGDKPLAVPAGDYALLGTINLGELVAAVELPTPSAPGQLLEFPGRERRGELTPADEIVKEVNTARSAFLAAFEQLPLAVVTVRRVGDELKLEIFQPKVQGGGLTPVINAGVNWFDKRMNLRDPNNPNFPGERAIYGKW